jgi:hypothetical protein
MSDGILCLSTATRESIEPDVSLGASGKSSAGPLLLSLMNIVGTQVQRPAISTSSLSNSFKPNAFGTRLITNRYGFETARATQLSSINSCKLATLVSTSYSTQDFLRSQRLYLSWSRRTFSGSFPQHRAGYILSKHVLWDL